MSRLFSDAGVYPALFNAGTDALRLVRSVEITRAVDAVLDTLERDSEGLEAGVAVHGRRLIAHVFMREVGDTFLADPPSDLGKALEELEPRVRTLVAQIVDVFPDNAYPGNVFKNQARCATLLMDAGLPQPASAT